MERDGSRSPRSFRHEPLCRFGGLDDSPAGSVIGPLFLPTPLFLLSAPFSVVAYRFCVLSLVASVLFCEFFGHTASFHKMYKGNHASHKIGNTFNFPKVDTFVVVSWEAVGLVMPSCSSNERLIAVLSVVVELRLIHELTTALIDE